MTRRMTKTAGAGWGPSRAHAGGERRVLRAPLATLALCAVMLACTPGFAPATESAAATERWPVVLGLGSELWIEGTSTLHDWSSRTDTLGLAFRVAPGTTRPDNLRDFDAMVRSQVVRAAEVEVPVRSLRSKESRLDKNLWKAMRVDEFPLVRFALSGYALSPVRPGSDTMAVRAKGTLTICGRERAIDLDATMRSADGGLWLVGSEELLMSEYGIRPPTMMLGTLRVGDRIQVHYRLRLVPGIAGMPAAAVGGNEEKGARR